MTYMLPDPLKNLAKVGGKILTESSVGLCLCRHIRKKLRVIGSPVIPLHHIRMNIYWGVIPL